MRLCKRHQLDPIKQIEGLDKQLKRIKAGIRAQVNYPLLVLRRKLGHDEARCQGLAKDTMQLYWAVEISATFTVLSD